MPEIGLGLGLPPPREATADAGETDLNLLELDGEVLQLDGESLGLDTG